MPQESDRPTDMSRRDVLKLGALAGIGAALGIPFTPDESQAARSKMETVTLDDYQFSFLKKRKRTRTDVDYSFWALHEHYIPVKQKGKAYYSPLRIRDLLINVSVKTNLSGKQLGRVISQGKLEMTHEAFSEIKRIPNLVPELTPEQLAAIRRRERVDIDREKQAEEGMFADALRLTGTTLSEVHLEEYEEILNLEKLKKQRKISAKQTKRLKFLYTYHPTLQELREYEKWEKEGRIDPKTHEALYEKISYLRTLYPDEKKLRRLKNIPTPLENTNKGWHDWVKMATNEQVDFVSACNNRIFDILVSEGKRNYSGHLFEKEKSISEKISEGFSPLPEGYPMRWFMEIPSAKDGKEGTKVLQVWPDGKSQLLFKEDHYSCVAYNNFKQEAFYNLVEERIRKYNREHKKDVIPFYIEPEVKDVNGVIKVDYPKETYKGLVIHEMQRDGSTKDVTKKWRKNLQKDGDTLEAKLKEPFYDRKNDRGYYYNENDKNFYEYQLSNVRKPHRKIDPNKDPGFQQVIQPVIEAGKTYKKDYHFYSLDYNKYMKTSSIPSQEIIGKTQPRMAKNTTIFSGYSGPNLN